MARPDDRQARTDALLTMTGLGGSIRLRDAAARLGVAEMTLRRDAARPGSPLRCLGGWLVPSGVAPEYDLRAETRRNIEAKRKAARHALDLIAPGKRIFLDCGTTTPHLAQMLPDGVRVVTHSLPVARLLAARDGVALELLGGPYHSESASFHAVPPPGMGRLDLAVLSAGGLGGGRLSCSYAHEPPVKRAAIAAGTRRVVLADSAKLAQRRTVDFAAASEVELLVTEAGIGPMPAGDDPATS